MQKWEQEGVGTVELDLKKLNQDIATLRKNRENVPLELLKTKYKKPYAKLKEEIRAQFEIYVKHLIMLGILKTGPDLTGAKAQSMVDQIQKIIDEEKAAGHQKEVTHAVGIPVGLFTSPWFCNFFFQDIDHKVAEKTGTAHNVRYVDDMVLFDSSKRRLHKALEFIEAEVKATKQTVKDNWQVFILSKRPLDFLGFKFHPNKTTIRKSIMLRISRKARTIARAAYASIRNAHAKVSYIGYIVNSDSQRFYEKWVRPFVNIKHLKGVIADEDRKQHQACVAV